MKHTRGYSLLESLITLALFSFLFLAGLSFLGSAKTHFHSLQDEYEAAESLYASCDRIRLDLEEAGAGLENPLRLGMLPGVSDVNDRLLVRSAELALDLPADLQPGQTRITLADTSAFKKGRLACVFDDTGGETVTIASVDPQYLILAQPLKRGYPAADSRLVLVRTVEVYLDQSSSILRRKVNTSPAQPLLEETSAFQCGYDKVTHLTRISIQHEPSKEKNHAFSIRPKNLVLAGLQ
jgi:prepilin-type N-terminal cleavage/methylation domain-containing protein